MHVTNFNGLNGYHELWLYDAGKLNVRHNIFNTDAEINSNLIMMSSS